MFESLKKKFSRTSDKLEEELIEEAQEENNLEEESGKKFSFFSFGRKDKKEEDDSESDVAEIPQEVESIHEEADTSDDEDSEDQDQNDEDAEVAVTTSGEMIKGYFSKDHKEFTTIDGISYHVNDGGEVVTESLDDDDDYFIEIEDDYEVAPGVHFIEDGQEYKYVRRIDDQYIDFDHWAVWECQSVDDESADSVYFIVEEDTGFIDWGPEDSKEAAIDFLNSKLDDFEDEEDGVYEL